MILPRGLALQRAHYPVTYDPLVLAYAEALMTSQEPGATGYIHADLRYTDKVLTHASELLDLTQPIAITMLAVLHAIPNSDDPYAIVAAFMDAVPSGSYLVISHIASDLVSRQALTDIADVTDRRVRQDAVLRAREQVARFFDGTDMVEPGLVRVEEWHPEPPAIQANKSTMWCAVGRKR